MSFLDFSDWFYYISLIYALSFYVLPVIRFKKLASLKGVAVLHYFAGLLLALTAPQLYVIFTLLLLAMDYEATLRVIKSVYTRN